MKIALAYIAVTHGKVTDGFAARFASTYHDFPPGADHTLTVICNGGPLSQETGLLFSGLGCRFYPRNNDAGWDCSAYREFARRTDADILVCLGESCYFVKPGWLRRIAETWEKHGAGMYGPFASHSVRAHLNTTAFACSPQHLIEYPFATTNKTERYRFEHGQSSLWRWLHGRGVPVMLVTWDGEWLPGQWRFPPNILWRGDQSNCLFRCSHTDDYDKESEARRVNWRAWIDKPFR